MSSQFRDSLSHAVVISSHTDANDTPANSVLANALKASDIPSLITD